jgi:outer membrane immunogenic protein
MRQLYLAASVAIALTTAPAFAADIPVRAPVVTPIMAPIYNWTGFYIGGNVGYHWDRDRATTAANPIGWSIAGAAAIDAITGGTVSPRGFIGGGQIGYNWQVSNNFLWGFEADANALGGSASRLVTGFAVINPADVFTTTAQTTFLATVRGRLGVTFDRALLYATGGLAIANTKFTDSFGSFGNTSIAAISSSSTHAGWTVGGGFEYGFADNWSAKLEYLYVDLGSVDTRIPSCALCGIGSDIGVSHKYTENIVRFGLNYRFGGPGPVVARY